MPRPGKFLRDELLSGKRVPQTDAEARWLRNRRVAEAQAGPSSSSSRIDATTSNDERAAKRRRVTDSHRPQYDVRWDDRSRGSKAPPQSEASSSRAATDGGEKKKKVSFSEQDQVILISDDQDQVILISDDEGKQPEVITVSDESSEDDLNDIYDEPESYDFTGYPVKTRNANILTVQEMLEMVIEARELGECKQDWHASIGILDASRQVALLNDEDFLYKVRQHVSFDVKDDANLRLVVLGDIPTADLKALIEEMSTWTYEDEQRARDAEELFEEERQLRAEQFDPVQGALEVLRDELMDALMADVEAGVHRHFAARRAADDMESGSPTPVRLSQLLPESIMGLDIPRPPPFSQDEGRVSESQAQSPQRLTDSVTPPPPPFPQLASPLTVSSPTISLISVGSSTSGRASTQEEEFEGFPSSDLSALSESGHAQQRPDEPSPPSMTDSTGQMSTMQAVEVGTLCAKLIRDLEPIFQRRAEEETREAYRGRLYTTEDTAIRLTEDVALTLSAIRTIQPAKSEDAYLNDSLLDTIILLEQPNTNTSKSFYAEIPLMEYWLRSGTTQEAIMRAHAGEQSEFPAGNMPTSAERLVFLYNPMGNHWVVVEASVDRLTQKNRLRGVIYIYDSSADATSLDRGTMRDAREQLPAVMMLASLRSGSPFAGASWDPANVLERPSPKGQDANVDCGVVCIDTAIHRLRDQDPPTTPGSDSSRASYGTNLRLRYLEKLHGLIISQESPLGFRGDPAGTLQQSSLLITSEASTSYSDGVEYDDIFYSVAQTDHPAEVPQPSATPRLNKASRGPSIRDLLDRQAASTLPRRAGLRPLPRRLSASTGESDVQNVVNPPSVLAELPQVGDTSLPSTHGAARPESSGNPPAVNPSGALACPPEVDDGLQLSDESDSLSDVVRWRRTQAGLDKGKAPVRDAPACPPHVEGGPQLSDADEGEVSSQASCSEDDASEGEPEAQQDETVTCPAPGCNFTGERRRSFVTHWNKRHVKDPTGIPCRLHCGSYYASYADAERHKPYCPIFKAMREKKDVPCRWRDVAGVNCNALATASHDQIHRRNRHGVPCEEGCGKYYGDVYARDLHMESCKGKRRERETFIVSSSYEYPRPQSMLSGASNRIVMAVIRSSSSPSSSWLRDDKGPANKAIEVATQHVDEFRKTYGFFGTSFVHAATHIATRYLPSPRVSDQSKLSPPERCMMRRAVTFTTEIAESLRTGSTGSQRPVLFSIGGDGWACHVEKIAEFIHEMPPFTLVIRFVGLGYGLTENYLRKVGSAWYGLYESSDIAQHLDAENTYFNAAIQELIGYWQSAQTWKDASGVTRGRNKAPSGNFADETAE